MVGGGGRGANNERDTCGGLPILPADMNHRKGDVG